MKTIEKKIIKKVYQYETKRIAVEFVFKTISLIFLVFSVIIIGQVIIEILKEQKTLDIFELFSEDSEVIRKYFFDTFYILYLEVPKVLLILWLLFFAFLSLLTLTLVRNFTKIKNRVISLLKFWTR